MWNDVKEQDVPAIGLPERPLFERFSRRVNKLKKSKSALGARRGQRKENVEEGKTNVPSKFREHGQRVP